MAFVEVLEHEEDGVVAEGEREDDRDRPERKEPEVEHGKDERDGGDEEGYACYDQQRGRGREPPPECCCAFINGLAIGAEGANHKGYSSWCQPRSQEIKGGKSEGEGEAGERGRGDDLAQESHPVDA